MTMVTVDPGTENAAVMVRAPDDASLICRLEGQLRGASPARRCAEGVRFVDEVDADVVAGPFVGGHLTGLERFTIRPDGTFLVAGPQTIDSGDDPMTLEIRGHVASSMESGWPRPEAVAAPGFEFPDIDFRLTGSALVRTTDPRYGHLDGAVASIEGWVNFESGEMEVEARAM